MSTPGITQKVGQIPGSLIYTGERPPAQKAIRLIQFNEQEVLVNQELAADEIFPKIREDAVNWVHFFTLNQVESIEKAGSFFDIHNLLLEDVLNVDHLPKVEFSEKHVFFTLKILTLTADHQLESEHASFILGNHYLISFKEQRGELLKPVTERVLKNIGKVRKKGADYLFYLLSDTIVDHYLLMVERFGQRIEELEDLLIDYPDRNRISEIHDLKRNLLAARKYVIHLREAVINLLSEEPDQLEEDNYRYLQDMLDHVKFVYESIETYREDQKSLVELNNSNMNNNLNQVMKTLTIIATIFIPLTFVAGIYGMNFKHMPELGWKYGYAGIWGIMVILSALMIWYMKRKRWF
ncbi:MAG: magnesium/cobalt transporter CorA [Bacteroidales bacterium]|jgi:magnesium transporter|nr:magnesium/cobalt transporter CorA [Bacteroidales bacterium]